MRILSRKTLREFWEKRPDARQALQAWYVDVEHATWKGPADIKRTYQTASFLQENRIVFNIKGNKYRIVVVIQFKYGNVYIRFIGTHSQYDQIDASTI
jgi:mRNA interferase HigB